MARNGFLIHMIHSSSRKNESSFFWSREIRAFEKNAVFYSVFPNIPMTVWVEFQMNLSAFLELPLVTNDSLPKKNNNATILMCLMTI